MMHCGQNKWPWVQVTRLPRLLVIPAGEGVKTAFLARLFPLHMDLYLCSFLLCCQMHVRTVAQSNNIHTVNTVWTHATFSIKLSSSAYPLLLVCYPQTSNKNFSKKNFMQSTLVFSISVQMLEKFCWTILELPSQQVLLQQCVLPLCSAPQQFGSLP